MTTVNPSTFESLGLAAAPNTAKSAKLGQEQFLELMIAQLKNQDPLKPLESGEFLGQIAQFSTVSGIQDLQKSFQELAGSLHSNQALQASALVGRTAFVPGPNGALADGGSISGLVELPSATGGLTVSVYDSFGQVVRRLSLGPQAAGSVAFAWDGKADDGSAAPAGVYQIKAEANLGGQNVAVDTLTAARVESVSLGRAGQGITLNLTGLGAIEFGQVRQIQ